MAVTTRLMVSLSGLTDDSLPRAAELAVELDARGIALSHLFRPGPLLARVAEPGLVDWLHRRRAGGDAVVLHGYDHSVAPLVTSALPRVGRKAEFATLPRHEANLRLRAARRTLGALDLRTDLFVPPRWIASAGTVEALRAQGFRVVADEHGVRLLGAEPESDVLTRARVLGFRVSGELRPLAENRKAAEALRCRMLVSDVVRAARRGEAAGSGLVRVNVRAKDLRRPARVDAVLAALDAALTLGTHPTTYALPTAAAQAA